MRKGTGYDEEIPDLFHILPAWECIANGLSLRASYKHSDTLAMLDKAVEEESKPVACFLAFHPASVFSFCWNFLGAVCIAFESIATPLRLFDLPEGHAAHILLWVPYFREEESGGQPHRPVGGDFYRDYGLAEGFAEEEETAAEAPLIGN